MKKWWLKEYTVQVEQAPHWMSQTWTLATNIQIMICHKKILCMTYKSLTVSDKLSIRNNPKWLNLNNFI